MFGRRKLKKIEYRERYFSQYEEYEKGYREGPIDWEICSFIEKATYKIFGNARAPRKFKEYYDIWEKIYNKDPKELKSSIFMIYSVRRVSDKVIFSVDDRIDDYNHRNLLNAAIHYFYREGNAIYVNCNMCGTHRLHEISHPLKKEFVIE